MVGENREPEERTFLELRRKVQESELLSAAVERLLRTVHFSGRLSIVVQNGHILKSGYEEGYFSHRQSRLVETPAASPNVWRESQL